MSALQNYNHKEFTARYKKWKSAIQKMPAYSKSTAYTGTKEYRDIIALGREAVPFLILKLKENKEMDFMLADAVIAIEGWDCADFPCNDLEQKRLAVIETWIGK